MPALYLLLSLSLGIDLKGVLLLEDLLVSYLDLDRHNKIIFIFVMVR